MSERTPEDAATRPVPDLGFFAGAPAGGAGSSFGGGAAPSGFGGAPTTGTFGGPPASNQFSGPPAGNQFGTAPVTQQWGAGPPPVFPGHAAPPAATGSRGGATTATMVRRVVVSVVVVFVLGLFGVGRLAVVQNWFKGDLEAPSTLGGMSRVTGPEVADQERTTAESLEAENSGDAVVATYGDATTFYSLAAQRVRVDIDRELADVRASGQGRAVGESTCASTSGVTMCVRTSRSLSVVVFSSVTPEQTSAAVDEAWKKF